MSKPIDRIGRVTNESVLKCTGRGWNEWISVLDRAGAKSWPHSELVAWLSSKFKQSPWWRQVVAGCYEIHHGKRVEGRSAKGLYSLAATKLPQKEAWTLLASEAGLAAWLEPFATFSFKKGSAYEVDGGVYGAVRTVKAPERLRFSWQEEPWAKASVVQLGVVKRPGRKCVVTITHEGIPGETTKAKLRARWKKGLEKFATIAVSRD
jgi:uncharacterized protein YndB with AHSA1/START domain